MSWGYDAIGTSADLCTDLDATLAKMSEGQCKVEFADAVPVLKDLLSQNFDTQNTPVYRLTASGSGYSRSNGEVTVQVNRSMSVKLERVYARQLTPAPKAE